MAKKIAFITYETPFAPCGGVASVMGKLPGYVQGASGTDVAVITPFHHRIDNTTEIEQFASVTGTITVGDVEARILRYEEWSNIYYKGVKNPLRLIGHLRDLDDRVSCFLMDAFPEDVRQRIETFHGDPETGFELARTIVTRLNLIIRGHSIYRESLFVNKKYEESLSQFVKKVQFDGGPQLLNYMLLQKSYPDCIPEVRMWPWYFIDAIGNGERVYFGGYPHPYMLDDRRDRNVELLSRDAMFFGRAVAQALPVIDRSAEWILLMQDWEGATAALALNGRLKRYRSFITLHNCYDSRVHVEDPCVTPHSEPMNQPDSILRRALAKANRPVFTVSGQFASDLTADPIQTRILAKHIQDPLKAGLVGINNGPFGSVNVPAGILESEGNVFHAKMRQWKIDHRKNAIRELRQLEGRFDIPVWGKAGELSPESGSCWLVMTGRDDPRQKGYDAAAVAARRVLVEGFNVNFIFLPIPGDEGLPGLSFLETLYRDFPDRVVVLPFRWNEGYAAILRGASFGIFPSFYEPFGGVSEFYFNGTPVIARTTGGLVQQIVPYVEIRPPVEAVRVRADRWHQASALPTGLLFRERDGIDSAERDWYEINAAEYDIGGGPDDRIGRRMQLGVFREMVDELHLCMTDAIDIFFNRQDAYYSLIKNGIRHIRNVFLWERAAREYWKHISKRERDYGENGG